MAYLTTTATGQPVLVLKEGTTRSRGKEAQRNNMMAARVIGEARAELFFAVSVEKGPLARVQRA